MININTEIIFDSIFVCKEYTLTGGLWIRDKLDTELIVFETY